MSDINEKMLARIQKLEREVERLRVGDKAVAITDHGALSGLSDDDHPQYLLTTGKAADSDKLDGYDSTVFGRPVFLATPKTSTSWDGDARSTTAKTKIDLSDVFGVPAGVKAVIVKLVARDSGSATGVPFFEVSPNDTSYSAAVIVSPRGLPNDTMAYNNGVVSCDANGDIYYQIDASGTDTMDVWLEIWGWYL